MYQEKSKLITKHLDRGLIKLLSSVRLGTACWGIAIRNIYIW